LRHCSTDEKIRDIFTKALGREKNETFIMMLGLTNIPSDLEGGGDVGQIILGIALL